MRQDGRACRVTLAGQVLLADFDTSRRRSGGRANRGLDVAFEITRTSSPDPQPSQVRVWGLSSRTRDILTRSVFEARERSYADATALQTAVVRVEAGRPGRVGVLSEDWIMETPLHERDGADWVTTLICQDGRLNWASAFVSESRSTTVDPAALARAQQEAQGVLGSGADALLAVDPQLVAEGFGRLSGKAVSFGNTRSNRQTLQLLNRTPIWQRGKIQWVRTDEPQGSAVELVEGATLLSLSEPAAGGFRDALCLLDPELELGRQVTIRRAGGRRLGPYRVDSVTYTGETAGVPWYAALKLRPTAGTAALAEVID